MKIVLNVLVKLSMISKFIKSRIKQVKGTHISCPTLKNHQYKYAII
jgi:hypothetical protein